MRRPKRNTRKSRIKKRKLQESSEDRVVFHGNMLFRLLRERRREKQRTEFTRNLALKGIPYKEIKHRMWLGECYI